MTDGGAGVGCRSPRCLLLDAERYSESPRRCRSSVPLSSPCRGDARPYSEESAPSEVLDLLLGELLELVGERRAEALQLGDLLAVLGEPELGGQLLLVSMSSSGGWAGSTGSI